MSNSKSGKGPVIAFLVILILGIGAAAYVFGPKIKELLAKENVEQREQPNENQGGDSSDAANMAQNNGNSATPGSTPNQPTESALLTEMTDKLKKGDVDGFLALAGDDSLSDQDKLRLKTLLKEHGFSPSAQSPFVELESNGDTRTWALNLTPPKDLAQLGPQQIRLSFKRAADGSWTVTSVTVPDVDSLVAKMKADSPSMDGKSAVFAAKNFVDAVINLDFQKAKNFVDEAKLTEEKLAALFIVVEQGAYKLREDKPMTTQVEKDDVAWMIANLQGQNAAKSQFGIEMERENKEQPWKIVALNFDQMMHKVAMEAGAGGIAYAPYKPNPQGGESLVLYFDFDDQKLNSRASKQLQVIANILKEDPSRQLHINGHADAIGDENYNERLSDGRAANVRGALLALGVKPTQVVTKAFGESAPKAPNFNPDGTDNTSGQAQNRRAEVHLKF